MKKLISICTIILFLIVSCKSQNDTSKLENEIEPNFRYFINSVKGDDASYLYVEKDNDTIYGYINKNGSKQYPKIVASKEIVQLIKENVLFHLDASNFVNIVYENNTNNVKFFIENSESSFLSGKSNVLKAEYNGGITEKDVSIKYDSLIKILKNNYLELKEF